MLRNRSISFHCHTQRGGGWGVWDLDPAECRKHLLVAGWYRTCCRRNPNPKYCPIQKKPKSKIWSNPIAKSAEKRRIEPLFCTFRRFWRVFKAWYSALCASHSIFNRIQSLRSDHTFNSLPKRSNPFAAPTASRFRFYEGQKLPWNSNNAWLSRCAVITPSTHTLNSLPRRTNQFAAPTASRCRFYEGQKPIWHTIMHG